MENKTQITDEAAISSNGMLPAVKKILVQDLINEGFIFGTYAGSKWIIPSNYYDTSATVQYRHPKGGVIDKNGECEFDGFTICNYGSSSCIGVPIKIKTIEDLRAFCKFF